VTEIQKIIKIHITKLITEFLTGKLPQQVKIGITMERAVSALSK